MEQRKITDIRNNVRHRKDLGDIASLADSIADIGLLHPIVVQPDGTLIAGERRLEAVKLLGWDKVPVRVVDLPSIVRGEHDENVFRKDFTPSEAIAIGQELEPMEREAAKERKATSNAERVNFTPSETGKSLDKVASAVGMSRPTYQKAKEVIEYAQAVNMPELVELMDNKGVEAAVKKVKERKRADQHQIMVEQANNVPVSKRWSVFQKDIRTARIDEPLDAIITDPPYPKEYLPLWNDLAKFAKQNLKTGGVLLAMTPAPYLPEILEMLGHQLDYQWILACTLPGSHGSVIKSGVRNVLWKPILVYRNGGDPVNIGSDMFANDKRDKDFHEWGQGVGGYVWQIENFTKPNDLICDPFLGGGTTAIASLMLKRRFVGFDVDAEKVAITKSRLNNAII